MHIMYNPIGGQHVAKGMMHLALTAAILDCWLQVYILALHIGSNQDMCVIRLELEFALAPVNLLT